VGIKLVKKMGRLNLNSDGNRKTKCANKYVTFFLLPKIHYASKPCEILVKANKKSMTDRLFYQSQFTMKINPVLFMEGYQQHTFQFTPSNTFYHH